MRLRLLGLISVVSALAVMVGCGGGGSKPTPPATLTITTGATLTPGTVGAAYTLTLAASGGTTPYTWSSTGTLPAGLTLSAAGVLSGTPTTAGSSSLAIKVTDTESSPQTATLAATLVINAAPVPLSITTTSPLTSGTVGAAYSLTFAATGGTAPYTWTVSTGTLPAGLTLSTAGVLSGTPTAAATSSFSVKVTDSGSTAQTATLAATLVINPAPPTITTTSPLPNGTLSFPYTATFTATGGTAPYTWALAAGSTLPAGLTLSPAGVLSGTPTASGASSFTVQVTDSASTPQTGSGVFALTIDVGTLAVKTTSLPTGNVGSIYSVQLAASGGVPPYTWALASGSTLPGGLTLTTTGLITGTPGATGTSSPTFTLSDSGGSHISAPLSLVINAATGTVPDNFYSFVFAGISPQGPSSTQNGVAINGIIKIQSGAVASGFYDENTNTEAPILKASITGGSLVLGANGLGQLVLTTATDTFTFALASPASVSTGGLTPIRMIEYDDATGTGSRGSGVIDPTPASPTTGGISGNFAFLLSGTDVQQNQQALIGSFQTDGKGNIVGGKADANQVVPVSGVPTREVANFGSVGGTYAVDSDGRGLLNLTLSGALFHYSFYEVSPKEWLAISLDPASLNSPLVSGIVYQQSGGPFTTASLPATSILEISGVKTATGVAPVPDITLGIATSDGAGNVSYKTDEYAGTLTTGGSLAVTYAVDGTTGRATSTAGANTQPILYIVSPTTALLLGVDESGSSGLIEAQTGTPFTAASFNGSYLGGSLPLVLTTVLNESGLVLADGAGNVSFTTNRSSSSGLAYQNNVVVGTYTVDSAGRGVITAPDGATRIFYVVSPTKIAFLAGDTGGYLGNFQQ